jgi:hypothetical protein
MVFLGSVSSTAGRAPGAPAPGVQASRSGSHIFGKIEDDKSGALVTPEPVKQRILADGAICM